MLSGRGLVAAVEARADRLPLDIVVHDDGIGFPGTATAGHGLTNLRDRIETLDGTMHIEGRAGAGTRLRAEIPIGGTT